VFATGLVAKKKPEGEVDDSHYGVDNYIIISRTGAECMAYSLAF
jgi:hypothetical protein